MIRRSKTLLLFTLTLSLLACGAEEERQALKSYVRTVKARQSGEIEPLPVIKQSASFTYPSKNRRSPFRAISKPMAQTKLSPDQNRPKEILENFMLDSLKMVGTLTRDREQWAIIAAPDGKFYRVHAGSYLGQNFGKVAKVDTNNILLEEIVQSDGVWEKRPTQLSLAEGKG
jgi:type IV pilus assembly protein PilP